MSIKGWPFLVSRNRFLGYQTVVAPDFMIEAQLAGLLSNRAGGDPGQRPKYCKLKTKIGLITLAYRVVKAADSNGMFRDEFGRPILWIEGIVFKGSVNGMEVTETDLHEAHKRIEKEFQEFWESTSNPSVKSSKPFMVPFEKNESQDTTTPVISDVNNQKLSVLQEILQMMDNLIPVKKLVTIVLLVSLGLNFLLAIYVSSLHKELSSLNKEVVSLKEENKSIQTANQKLQSMLNSCRNF